MNDNLTPYFKLEWRTNYEQDYFADSCCGYTSNITI